jgi:hypothetical protein
MATKTTKLTIVISGRRRPTRTQRLLDRRKAVA